MLGYVQATDRDLESVFGECVDMCTAVNHDPARVSVKSAFCVTSVISCGFVVFGINKFCKKYFCIFYLQKLFWN